MYRNREIEISAQITSRINEELENAVEERTRELVQAQAQLIQYEKMAAMGQMAAGVAHEINNPLTVIVMNTAFLLESAVGDEKTIKKLRAIEKQADRAAEVVRSLLSFSRKSRGTRRDSVRIESVIEEALEPIEHQLSLSNIEIVREIADDVPAVEVNSNQIGQVFFNLINNAADAMSGGGKIIIRVFPGPEPGTQRKRTGGGRPVIVEISDTGEGISQEGLDKLFDPFFTTKEAGKGVGLGLFISQKIIHEHGGQIKVSSEVGKGTTFTIELPS